MLKPRLTNWRICSSNPNPDAFLRALRSAPESAISTVAREGRRAAPVATTFLDRVERC
jgi:hypothetical protein